MHIGYKIFQSKGLTFYKIEKQVKAPLLHWHGDDSICGDWCVERTAAKEEKLTNRSLFLMLTMIMTRAALGRCMKLKASSSYPKN